MNEKNLHAAAAETAIQEGVKAKVRIALEKKPGETAFRRHIEANDARAALNGLAVLMIEYARLVGIDVTKVLSLLAVCLTVPVLREESEGYKGGEEQL